MHENNRPFEIQHVVAFFVKEDKNMFRLHCLDYKPQKPYTYE